MSEDVVESDFLQARYRYLVELGVIGVEIINGTAAMSYLGFSRTSVSYTCDGAGNIASKTVGGAKTSYSYSSYNRLSSAGSVSFTNDANGNTATKTNGTAWTHSYDYENRLTKVKSGSTVVSLNTYDGDGRLLKSVETSTQVFAYQGLNRVYAKNTGSGSMVKHYWADGLLVLSVTGTTSYYHEDALGSVRLVSDAYVTTLFSSNFRPYGLTFAQ